ncbi:hypothetical protein JHD48_05665 [Sulfurimonas sp. SAG-AH-194-I05]|nr:hypothetical protein [Sulfurimonas sp. SAG-AH-194-I05]MDF1875212.1 hypothetical protein [Sulfurimonas sp. SAG-AH-194-I05]
MLPVILGAVALGTVGFGIKKCMEDEACLDSLKDKVQDGVFALADAQDKVEEYFNLNAVTLSDDALTSAFFTGTEKSTPPNIKAQAKATLDTFFTSVESLQGFEDASALSEAFSLNDTPYKDEYKSYIEISEYVITINKVAKLLENETNKIQEMLKASLVYESFEKDEKDTINKTYILADILKELLTLKLLKKSGKLNKKLEDEILKANRYLFKLKVDGIPLQYKNFLKEPEIVDLFN